MLNRILGMWALAAGISLVFSFFKTYRGRPRYVYVALLGAWAILWGLETVRQVALAPDGVLWAVFLAGIAAMLFDSVRRYRETSARLRRERQERKRRARDGAGDEAGNGKDS